MKLFRKLQSKKIILFAVIILIIAAALTGCVTSTAKGWSGVAVSGNNLYIGSQKGELLGLDASNPDKTLFNPVNLNISSSGGLLGCGGSTIPMNIYGTPVVVDNTIYFAGYSGKVYAFSSDKGVEQWHYPQSGLMAPVIGGLCYDNGNLYFGGNDGRIYALDAQSGSLVWNSPFATGNKVWATPVISGDTLFVGSFDHKMYALNPADGTLKWSYETQGPIISTPIIQNGTVYFGSLDRYFYALNAKTGKLIWKTQQAAGKWFWANPVLANNDIYAPNLDGKVYVLNTTNGELISSVKLGYSISSSPVLVGNSLYLATENGNLWSVDVIDQTAKSIYDYRKTIYAPLTFAKVSELEGGNIITINALYVVTTDNNLHVFNTNTNRPVGGWETVSLNH